MAKILSLSILLLLACNAIGKKLRIRPRKKELNIYVKEKEIISCLFNRKKYTDVEWLIENDSTGLSISVEEAKIQGIRVRRRRGELQLILRPKTGAGYHFVCSGYDDRNDKLHEKNIHVNIIEPARIISKNSRLEFVQGSDAEIHCQTTGYPIPHIHWTYKKYVSDEYDSISPTIDNRESHLSLKNISKDDEGWYQCEIFQDHLLGQSDHYHFPAAFHVTVTSAAEDAEQLENIGAYVAYDSNGDVRLFCDVENDQELAFQWHKQGYEHEIHIGNTLAIDNPVLEDAGIYICTVTNTFGSNSVQVQVDIKGKSTSTSSPTSTQRVSRPDITSTVSKVSATTHKTSKSTTTTSTNIPRVTRPQRTTTVATTTASTTGVATEEHTSSEKSSETTFSTDSTAMSTTAEHTSSALSLDTAEPTEISVTGHEKSGSDVLDYEEHFELEKSVEIYDSMDPLQGISILTIPEFVEIQEASDDEDIAPVPPVITISGLTSCREGESVLINCNATGYPKPTVKFLLNGQEISNDTSTGMLVFHNKNGVQLKLERCFTEYRGQFECAASNVIAGEEFVDIKAVDVDVQL